MHNTHSLCQCLFAELNTHSYSVKPSLKCKPVLCLCLDSSCFFIHFIPCVHSQISACSPSLHFLIKADGERERDERGGCFRKIHTQFYSRYSGQKWRTSLWYWFSSHEDVFACVWDIFNTLRRGQKINTPAVRGGKLPCGNLHIFISKTSKTEAQF